MARGFTRSTLQQLQTLFSAGTAAGSTDGELLDRFLERRVESSPTCKVAESAFAALVDRHGPMVRGVCLRILGNVHEAEDAFQATFLILARRARGVRGETLGRWLYGVARKVARRARRDSERRRAMPPPVAGRTSVDPVREAELGDLRTALDEELGRLRADYRAAIELCHLQGMTQEEAARRLACSARTVKGRLSAGRLRLRARLARRGLAPAAAVSAAAVTREASASVSAAVPAALARSTVRLAMFSATNGDGVFPASIAALATGAMRAMYLSKLTLTTAVVFGLGATCAGVYAFQDPAPAPEKPPAADLAFPLDRPRAQAPQALPAPQPGDGPRPGDPRTTPPADPNRPLDPDKAHGEIMDLTQLVHRLLLEGRRAEAQGAVHRLSETVQKWERAIRAEGRPNGLAAENAPNLRSRALDQPRINQNDQPPRAGNAYPEAVSEYVPTVRARNPSPAAVRDSDQERRIHRLEVLIEKLLSDRGGSQK